jgi:hypothetical protein
MNGSTMKVVNLTKPRLDMLEELYFEGPMNPCGGKEWRALTALHKVGYVELNEMPWAQAIAEGYKPAPDDHPDDDEYVVLNLGALWRISDRGRKALEAFYERGDTRVYPPLELVFCAGVA